MLDSLVRVSRRVAWDHYASVLGYAADLSPPSPHATKGYKHSKRSHVPKAFLGRREPTLAQLLTIASARSQIDGQESRADAKRFPFNNFTHCFTLFSKCFSSFDHSTCSLSVSCQYLALDEIYHPF